MYFLYPYFRSNDITLFLWTLEVHQQTIKKYLDNIEFRLNQDHSGEQKDTALNAKAENVKKI